MPDFEPRDLLPTKRNPGEGYPWYALFERPRTGLGRFFGPDIRVFGIVHPYSVTHPTKEGYLPLIFMSSSRDEANAEALRRWSYRAPYLVVLLRSLVDKSVLESRRQIDSMWD